ncbi:hypothetical protein Xen7305DRAFT_00011930 [Xenococcus sp. PCC 7305]|uniref:hypothetical protein n=1 Tax=Xenococcus sp. PCC 7305 TaxID=102125 RepID=UPI0002ACF283|nr:hypothetical protein [Xenococcus sp. PCC 7305]ELS01489.1 hypothetical protein Xen7305DRAFT_00011930 [Xenococcus sp. PCC 7305]
MASNNLPTQQSSGKVNTRFSLVNSLLAYPDRVTTILEDHEEMLDYALVQLLENISEYMKMQNRFNTAHFLNTLTNQIQQNLDCHRPN